MAEGRPNKVKYEKEKGTHLVGQPGFSWEWSRTKRNTFGKYSKTPSL